MPKLTLQFRGKPIGAYPIQDSRVTIGRDASNTIIIDSLAIAPEHLSLEVSDEGYTIVPKTDVFPVLLNNQEDLEQTLKHGDIINLGKHCLRFTEDVTTFMGVVENEDTFDAATESTQGPTSAEPEDAPAAGKESELFAPVTPKASLQFMSGANIGRLIPLNRKVTEIKHHDLVPAIIARRPNGFVISRLLDDVEITIAGEPLSTDHPLNPGDQIRIGDQKLQFFDVSI